MELPNLRRASILIQASTDTLSVAEVSLGLLRLKCVLNSEHGGSALSMPGHFSYRTSTNKKR